MKAAEPAEKIMILIILSFLRFLLFYLIVFLILYTIFLRLSDMNDKIYLLNHFLNLYKKEFQIKLDMQVIFNRLLFRFHQKYLGSFNLDRF